MKRLFHLFVALASLTSTYAQDSDSSELYHAYLESLPPVQRDLILAVDRIAAERGVSIEDVRREAQALLLDQECISKGSVGSIRHPVYVIIDPQENRVIDDSGRPIGANSDTEEVFVFCQGVMVGRVELPKNGGDDVILAMFTPKKIRFFDWKRMSGGFYLRRNETKEAEPGATDNTDDAQRLREDH